MAIGDSSLPEIRFSSFLPRTLEASGYVSLDIELSEAVTAPITFSYRTSDGSADDGFDYSGRSGTVTIAAGEQTASVDVYVRSDTLAESDEFYFVELFNPVGATFGGRNHSLRSTSFILDNDAGGGQSVLAVAAPVVLEGTGKATFTISLSEAAATSTVVDYATVADFARAGSDFTARSGSVTIAAGETEATVNVDLKNDRVSESGEVFGLKVAAAGGLTAYGQANLLDDDGPVPVISIEGVTRVESSGYLDVTLRLSELQDQPVTVDYRTINGTADSDVDFSDTSGTVTFAAGSYTADAQVYVRADTLGEPDEFWVFELFNPVGAGFGGRNHSLRSGNWIIDEDAGGGDRAIDVVAPTVTEGKGQAVFTVSLSEAFAADTEVSYATVAGSAAKGDFIGERGKLTFYAGQTEATVAVDLKNDGKLESAETFGLRVTGPGGLKGFGAATLLDDDGRVPVLSIEGIERVEASGYQKVMVRLSEAADAPVTVQLRTVDGTASASGLDYSSLDTQVTFAAGDTAATAQVYLRSDTASEADEFFFVALSTPVGGRFGPGDLAPRATVWIRDDDAGAQKRALAISDVKATESAGTANFTISVSRPLEDDLVIGYKTQNGTARSGSDFVADKGKVTLFAGATEAVVSVKLKDDHRSERDETFKLKLTSFDHGDFAPSGHDTVATGWIGNDDGHNNRTALDFDTLL